MAKTIACDHCGVVGAKRREDGPRVVEVGAGVRNGGRVLDLCGECRKEFHALVDGWLGREEGEPARIMEPDDPGHAEFVRKVAADHGFPLSDWTPSIVDSSEMVLAAQVARGGAQAWSDDPGDECGCGFCVPGERRAA